MRYIDKTEIQQEGRAITEDYIKTHCTSEDHRYINISYSTFCSLGYGAKMIECLRKAQGNYCCYCMRDISMNSGIVTLEHLIPQHPGKGDILRYRQLGIKSLNAETLSLADEFTHAHNQTMPPYPNNVAFDNFLNSCNGTFPDKGGSSLCCNNKRGNDYAIPLPLYSDANQMVVYQEKGDIQPNAQHPLASDIAVAIAAYRLKCDNLKVIRRMWYLLRHSNYDTLVRCLYDADLRSKTLISVLFKNSRYLDIDSKAWKYNNPEYWKTFLSYHWFQKKYQQLYP